MFRELGRFRAPLHHGDDRDDLAPHRPPNQPASPFLQMASLESGDHSANSLLKCNDGRGRATLTRIRIGTGECRACRRTGLDRKTARLSLSSVRASIGTEDPIPEEMDHREIAVRVPVMNEVQFLFASEPCKPLKPRSLYVVFLVEKDVRVERRRTRDDLNHEEILLAIRGMYTLPPEAQE